MEYQEYVEADVFNVLNSINVNEHTSEKMDLTYLSWAWAWAEVKKRFPDAYYTIYENKDGVIYFHDTRTAWVKVGVTIKGLEHKECLPVMDFKKKSVPLEKVTSMEVNTAIQRAITKALARHGLGLYIYAGEDIPEASAEEEAEVKSVSQSQTAAEPQNAPAPRTVEAEPSEQTKRAEESQPRKWRTRTEY